MGDIGVANTARQKKLYTVSTLKGSNTSYMAQRMSSKGDVELKWHSRNQDKDQPTPYRKAQHGPSLGKSPTT
jgi:hypothetical protein